MRIAPSDIEAIGEAVAPLIGLPVWAVHKLAMNMLVIFVGKKRVMEDDKALPPSVFGQGEWGIWIATDWRLEGATDVIVSSGDDKALILPGVQQLVDTRIDSIRVFPPGLDTHFTFSGQRTLKVFPVETQESLHWRLYAPQGRMLNIGPGNTYSFASKGEPQKDEHGEG